MKQQEDQFLSEPEDIEDIIPIKQKHEELPPKAPTQLANKPQLKRVQIEREKQFYLYRPFKIQKEESSSEEEETNFERHQLPFKQFYAEGQCVYMRHNNSNFNRFKEQIYYAGQFVNRNVFIDSNCSQTHELTDILREYYDIDPVNLQINPNNTLIFDSKFQSGNLFAAMKVKTACTQISESEYDLIMQNDTNSTGTNQWFYFSVAGLKPGHIYTFSVVNYTKSDSLFNYGMKPVVYSLQENKHVFDLQKGWKRVGEDVCYKKGKLPRESSHRMYYRLTFKLSTPFEQDKLWIAHSYPYTFSKLTHMIHEKRSKCREYVEIMEIGKTLSKRPIEALVIAYPINKKRDNRKAVIIMARQHPGETQGSYVCQGVIEKLLLKSKEVQFLLKNFVFYVIPMINPDGVIFGHYRTNLAGKDLNRKWNTSDKDLNCPEVTAIKNFLSDVNKNREIRFILDLHGHSRKLNSFFYGNPYPDCPEVVRIFPFICSKLHPGVQFSECTFATEEQKRKAARVYLNFMLKLVHVYTFESSFYAYQKEGTKIEFTQKQYRNLGGTLISGLFLQLQHQIKYQQVLEFNIKRNKQYLSSPFVKYLLELKNNSALMMQGAQAQSGSESKPEEGQIDNQEIDYGKINRVPSSLGKNTKSKSNRIPRKAASEMKDMSFARPIRNLKYLQISKINSFLPEKDGFCLQPIKKKDPEQVSKSLKSVASCQTEMNLSHQSLFREFSLSEVEQANLSHSYIPDQQTQRKNSIVRPMHNKNNVIFRLQFMTNTSEHYASERKKKTIKNALSQTLMTFSSPEFSRQKKQKTQHWSENMTEREEGSDWWLKAGQIKLQTPFSSLMLKKDAAVYFNGMVEKFMSRKEHSRSHDMPMSRLDRSFSIKKKQIKR